jgi:hypothetical protein
MKQVIAALLWTLLVHAAVLKYKPGDEVLDRDEAPCRILSTDAEDPDKPYELLYSNGESFWAAESEISLRVVTSAKRSKTDKPSTTDDTARSSETGKPSTTDDPSSEAATYYISQLIGAIALPFSPLLRRLAATHSVFHSPFFSIGAFSDVSKNAMLVSKNDMLLV